MFPNLHSRATNIADADSVSCCSGADQNCNLPCWLPSIRCRGVPKSVIPTRYAWRPTRWATRALPEDGKSTCSSPAATSSLCPASPITVGRRQVPAATCAPTYLWSAASGQAQIVPNPKLSTVSQAKSSRLLSKVRRWTALGNMRGTGSGGRGLGCPSTGVSGAVPKAAGRHHGTDRARLWSFCGRLDCPIAHPLEIAPGHRRRQPYPGGAAAGQTPGQDHNLFGPSLGAQDHG